MGGEQRFYNKKFYRELEDNRDSARAILSFLIELLKPESIVDIGCGTGQWLAAAGEFGVKDILGVDGEWVSQSHIAIPRERFLARDLTTRLNLGRRFDLALSLEVAEHMPDSRAKSFVEDLCHAADCVLFSAAIPGQGGRRHVNEQWPSYWAEQFNEFGHLCYDLVRPKVWNNPCVRWYYSQNCLVFAKGGMSERLGDPVQPLALVHPTLWSAQVRRMNSPGKLLERLPKAVFSALRGR